MGLEGLNDIRLGEELSGRRYGADHADDVRFRVVADHVRSSLMLMGDGVTPGNEGRGYILRRLMRRSIRGMRLLGVHEATFPTLFRASFDAMSTASGFAADTLYSTTCVSLSAWRRSNFFWARSAGGRDMAG